MDTADIWSWGWKTVQIWGSISNINPWYLQPGGSQVYLFEKPCWYITTPLYLKKMMCPKICKNHHVVLVNWNQPSSLWLGHSLFLLPYHEHQGHSIYVKTSIFHFWCPFDSIFLYSCTLGDIPTRKVQNKAHRSME